MVVELELMYIVHLYLYSYTKCIKIQPNMLVQDSFAPLLRVTYNAFNRSVNQHSVELYRPKKRREVDRDGVKILSI